MLTDEQIIKSLELMLTPGAYTKYLWDNPQFWVDTQQSIIEDAEGDHEIDRETASMFSDLKVSHSGEKRRVYKQWNLTHIEEAYRLPVVASLNRASWLSEEQFNFLTNGNRFGLLRPVGYQDHFSIAGEISLQQFERKILQQFKADPEHKRLAIAFSKQMIDEAEPHRQRCIVGQYELEKVPLQQIDNLFTYDALRMVIDNRGIAASFIASDKDATYYSPFVWSPDYFSGWSMGGEESWAVQVMMACIWRDACVVKKKAYTEQPTAGHRNERKRTRQAKLVLPRQISICKWSTSEERHAITNAQSVRAHYRELPEGWKTSQQAMEAAKSYGYPEPPIGWTFVQPHQRGADPVGEPVPAITQVVCRGLKVAKVALG